MVKNLFGYNYNCFWEPIRQRLETNSENELDKEVLKRIPELNLKEILELKNNPK